MRISMTTLHGKDVGEVALADEIFGLIRAPTFCNVACVGNSPNAAPARMR